MNCHICKEIVTPRAGGTLQDDSDGREYPLCSLHFVTISRLMLALLHDHNTGCSLVVCSRANCQNRVDKHTAAQFNGGYFCVSCAKVIAEEEYQKRMASQRMNQLSQVNSPAEQAKKTPFQIAREVFGRHEEIILKWPNVTGCGLGEGPAIIVYTDGPAKVPSKLEGVPIKVVKAGAIKALKKLVQKEITNASSDSRNRSQRK